MAKILKLNEISEVAEKEFPAGYTFAADVKNPDGIMLRSFNMHDYPLNDELLAVARAGAGTNNIPIPDCTAKGIVVFNTPGANANAVKELVLCELLLGGRKIVDAIDWVKTLKGTEGISKAVEKGKSKFVGHEITGKTLGVIGLGAIGVMVANAAADLGMKVLGYDPYLSVQGALHLYTTTEMSDLDSLLKKADFITVHVPLTPSTEKMFNAETFAKMKEGSVLINNSRGELVDELFSKPCAAVNWSAISPTSPPINSSENTISSACRTSAPPPPKRRTTAPPWPPKNWSTTSKTVTSRTA